MCNGWRVDGACDNAMSARVAEVDEAVLGALRRDVLAPEIVEDVITRAIALHTSEPDAAEERCQRLTSERERLLGELLR